ncbi:MAG: Holliday junction branch migration protein RuvA [Clostridiales bacterium]|nr:Holliday junction branch migration protein RuvA [Clostridiales bacterium]
MYAFLKGTVANIGEDTVTIDVGGVGYEVYCTTGAMGRLMEGKEAMVYTHLNVKEDEMTLFGFLSADEKAMFRRLITVSGVGPKMALGVLSVLSPADAALAIATGDDAAFSRVSGIGKKTAQRIILDLKGKVDPAKLGVTAAAAATTDAGAVSEAVAVLMAMGFDASDASAAVALIKAEGGTSEQMAMRALRALDRK